jgi:hypothetical protein
MILADSRFKKASRYEKLPKWIKKCLSDSHIDMTFEMAFNESSNFFRTMGRKFQLVLIAIYRAQSFTKLNQILQPSMDKPPSDAMELTLILITL